MTALEQSIIAWSDPTTKMHTDETCPLCTLCESESKYRSDKCSKCPIAKESGYDTCENTPYLSWVRDVKDYGGYYMVDMGAFDDPEQVKINFEEANKKRQKSSIRMYTYLVMLHRKLRKEQNDGSAK